MLARRGHLLLASLGLFAFGVSAGTVRLEVIFPDGDGPAAGGRLDAMLVVERAPEPGARRTEPPRPARVPLELSPSAESSIDLAPGAWKLALEIPGYWSPLRTLEVGEAETHHRIKLWSAGDLIAQAVAEDEDALNEAIRTYFQPAAKRDATSRAEPAGVVVCGMADGTWRCTLPAGNFDLRIVAGDYVSQYFWDVEIPVDGTRSLGKLTFRRGAGVIGWVTTEDGRTTTDGTRIRLLPRGVHPQSNSLSGARLDRVKLSTIANHRGFFQIVGVPPGEYVLEATKKAYAPARVTVQVQIDRVTEIDDPPILLREPQTVDFYVDPPVPPKGGVWSIELIEVDRSSSAIAFRATDAIAEDGRWRISDLAPARYRLSLGFGAEERWYARDVEIIPSQAPIFIEVPIVEVRGTVSLGDGPLAAELWFGRRSREVTVPLASDAEGHFQGHLPRDGPWDLEVVGIDSGVRRSFQGLRVAKRRGKSYAEIDVYLPDTVLRGIVVDQESLLAPGAIVTAQSLDEVVAAVRLPTDESGEFEILGLPAGRTTLIAEGSRGDQPPFLYSEDVGVDLEDGGAPSRVRLVLRPERRLSGRVMVDGRGVPGATVKADPTHVLGLPAFPEISDAQGAFEVRIPAHARDLSLSVGAPGFGFRSLRIPVTVSQPVVVAVSEASGTLAIELPEDVEPTSWSAPKVMLYHNGAVESLGYLLSWASFNGQRQQEPRRFLVPRMEPGEYVACLMPASERFERLEGGSTRRPCVSGYLPSSGELELSF